MKNLSRLVAHVKNRSQIKEKSHCWWHRKNCILCSKVSIDIFTIPGKNNGLILSYFLSFEMAILDDKAKHVILCIKSIFARHDVPDIIMSAYGLKFNGCLFKKFAVKFGLSV